MWGHPRPARREHLARPLRSGDLSASYVPWIGVRGPAGLEPRRGRRHGGSQGEQERVRASVAGPSRVSPAWRTNEAYRFWSFSHRKGLARMKSPFDRKAATAFGIEVMRWAVAPKTRGR